MWQFHSGNTPLPFRTASKVAERFERRILDEISKMFNDSDSFYFSLTGDITNSVQRQANSQGQRIYQNFDWLLKLHEIGFNICCPPLKTIIS